MIIENISTRFGKLNLCSISYSSFNLKVVSFLFLDNVSPTSPVILVTSSHRLAPTQSVAVVYTVGTENTEVWNNHNTTIQATATTITDLTQANVLMMLGIIWSYFLSRW